MNNLLKNRSFGFFYSRILTRQGKSTWSSWLLFNCPVGICTSSIRSAWSSSRMPFDFAIRRFSEFRTSYCCSVETRCSFLKNLIFIGSGRPSSEGKTTAQRAVGHGFMSRGCWIFSISREAGFALLALMRCGHGTVVCSSA